MKKPPFFKGLVAQWQRTCLLVKGMWVWSLAGKMPWRRKWQPTLVLLPGKSHKRRSLEGYSLWGSQRFDRAWWLNNSNKKRLEAKSPCVNVSSSWYPENKNGRISRNVSVEKEWIYSLSCLQLEMVLEVVVWTISRVNQFSWVLPWVQEVYILLNVSLCFSC